MRPESPSGIPSHLQYQSLIGPLTTTGIRLKAKQRSQTPEILLVPNLIDNSRIYYEYQEPRALYSVMPRISFHQASDLSSNSNMSGISRSKVCTRNRNKKEGSQDQHGAMYKSYRIPSDLDSQISLPRSYTLPREFRYYRRPKTRKAIRTEHFITSNNSSDGDVDSADENDEDIVFSSSRVTAHIRFHPYPQTFRNSALGQLHETKL